MERLNVPTALYKIKESEVKNRRQFSIFLLIGKRSKLPTAKIHNRSLSSKRVVALLHFISHQLLVLLFLGRCLLQGNDVLGARGTDFLLIGLLDALLCLSGGVCSLRGIGESPLVGPFLFISEIILNTSPIFFNFSSRIFSFLDMHVLSSSGLSSP